MPISLDDALEGYEPANEYLSGPAKRAWAAAHTPFNLYGVKKDERNKYGARWLLDVTTIPVDEDEEPETHKIGLQCNTRRDGLMAQLLKSLGDGGVIGPLELQLLELEEGTQVWTIQGWMGNSNADSSSSAA